MNFPILSSIILIPSIGAFFILLTKGDHKNVEKNFDVLCIDVEGAEWKILEVFEIEKWRPKMAIIETHEKHENLMKRMSGNSEQINQYFFDNEYKQVYVDEVNSIYVDERIWG